MHLTEWPEKSRRSVIKRFTGGVGSSCVLPAGVERSLKKQGSRILTIAMYHDGVRCDVSPHGCCCCCCCCTRRLFFRGKKGRKGVKGGGEREKE